MSDFDDLDSLLGPLREPATPAELASERAMIDLMTTSHRHAKGTIMFSSRRARVATLIAAGVIGFGGVAAAGGGGLDLDNLAPQEVEEAELEGVAGDRGRRGRGRRGRGDHHHDSRCRGRRSDDDTFTDEVAKATLAVAGWRTSRRGRAESTSAAPRATMARLFTRLPTARPTASRHRRRCEVRDAAHSECGKTDEADGATRTPTRSKTPTRPTKNPRTPRRNPTEVDDDSDADEGDDSDDDEDADGVQGRPRQQGNGNDGNRGKSGHDD